MTEFTRVKRNFRSCLSTLQAMKLLTLKVKSVSPMHRLHPSDAFLSETINDQILSLDVDDLVEHRRKINHVSVQKFDSNSQHVAHLRHNPEKYTEALKLFLIKVTDKTNAL